MMFESFNEILRYEVRLDLEACSLIFSRVAMDWVAQLLRNKLSNEPKDLKVP